MKPFHIPRSLLFVIIAIVALTFLVGTLRAFATAHAATPAAVTATPTGQIQPTSLLIASVLIVAAVATIVFFERITESTDETPVLQSADTTGIIALGIVIVLIVLVGSLTGGSKFWKKRT